MLRALPLARLTLPLHISVQEGFSYKCFRISLFRCTTVNLSGVLIGIALTLQIAVGRTDIFATQSFGLPACRGGGHPSCPYLARPQIFTPFPRYGLGTRFPVPLSGHSFCPGWARECPLCSSSIFIFFN